MVGSAKVCLLQNSEIPISDIPTVSLSFDNVATDTGSLGLTWTKSINVAYDNTSSKAGGYSLKRAAAGSSAGFGVSNTVIDYTKDARVELWFASLVKPSAGRFLFIGIAGGATRGLSLFITATGTLTAQYTPGSAVSVNVAGATDISANATYQKAEIIWNATAKTIELKIEGVSIGTSSVADDNTPGVTSFDILGDAGGTSSSCAGNIDEFKVYQ